MTRRINRRKYRFSQIRKPMRMTSYFKFLILFSIIAPHKLILKYKKINGFRLILPPETMTSHLHNVFRFVRFISFVFSRFIHEYHETISVRFSCHARE